MSYKKGQIITLYPCDYFCYYPSSDRHIEGHWSRYSKAYHIDKEINKKTIARINGYAMNIDEKYDIIGDPLLIDDPCYLGHMINDGARSSCLEDRHIYEIISFKLSNVYFKIIRKSIVLVIALKDIEPDSELLVSYGYNYWSTH